MTKTIHFTKMHGCGNDYIYVDTMRETIDDPVRAAIVWSDRHKGIGSDGLVLIGRSPVPEADFTMRIFNADGSEAMMCGNASRCIGKYLYERGLTTQTHIRLLTLSGVKTISLSLDGNASVASVTVDMLAPVLANEEQFVGGGTADRSHGGGGIVGGGTADRSRGGGGTLPEGVFVSMGNPHYVVFTDDVDRVESDGPRLERHGAFPQRCNIEFAQVLADGRIRTRVWERGSGITMACGTGACATAVAAALTERAGRRSLIVMDGGTLSIEWRETDNHVLMTGPAAFVFDGEIALP